MVDNGDRLSRIEAILEALAQRSVEADQRLTRIEQAQERNQQQFSEANERLTRIEQGLVRIEQAIDETRKIAESNARSVQAWSLTIETDRIEREEAESELRVDITAVQQTLSQTAELQQTLLNVQLRDRAEWRQQRAEVNQQTQALIDNQNQDRRTWHEHREQLSTAVQESQHQIQALIGHQNSDRQEWQQRSAHLDQQIQSLIDLSRENIQAHAAFRSDIQRIWNRLAG